MPHPRAVHTEGGRSRAGGDWGESWRSDWGEREAAIGGERQEREGAGRKAARVFHRGARFYTTAVKKNERTRFVGTHDPTAGKFGFT
jgi:hypothetical protein